MQSVNKTLASLFFPIAGSRITALNRCFLPEPNADKSVVGLPTELTGITELFLPGQSCKARSEVLVPQRPLKKAR
jgi:hypothetical protein